MFNAYPRPWVAFALVLLEIATSTLPANAQTPQATPGTAPASTPAKAPVPVAVAVGPDEIVQKITSSRERLNMQINGTRILALDSNIPRAAVENPDILDLRPVSAKQVQIHAKKTGVTTVSLWDENNQIRTVEVVVYGDVRELELVLKTLYPNAAIKLYPTTNSVILAGHIDDPKEGPQVELIAKDYFPKVINALTVGGSQQVLLHVRVMEISRTKLRDLGFDFANVSGNGDFAFSKISGLLRTATSTGVTATGAETFAFGIIDQNNSFFGLLTAMQRDQILRVLAEPTLSTVSGRPAYFQVGGEIPILIPQSLGTVSIEFKKFGTQVDFVPIVLGNGNVRLEVRPRVSELDNTISVTLNGSTIPGFRTREVDTGVELQFGQTFALAGLIQNKEQTEKVGYPYIMDIPYVGAAFSRKTSRVEEVELLIMVRPEPAEGLDCHETPPCGPGMYSTSPPDFHPYWKQEIEHPKQCPSGGCGPGAMPGPGPEAIDPGQVVPGGGVQKGRPAATVANRNSTGSGRVQANPVSAPRSSRNSSYNRHNTKPQQTRPGSKQNSAQPGLIGPTGYDVVN